MQSLDVRIVTAVQDEEKQMLQNAMAEPRNCNTWDPVLAEKKKQERKGRKAALSIAKQQAELEWMESQRRRVKDLRKNIDRHEALKCYGYSPGERTLTDDWSFWHGFDVARDASVSKKSDVIRRAKHGKGCGGSVEWIEVLRERRSRMNRIIAENKKVLQMKSNIERQKNTEMQSTEFPARSIPCKQNMHIARKVSSKRRHRELSKTVRMRKNSNMHARVCSDDCPNKCLQEAILSLARKRSTNVYEVLLRMFRATCSNASGSGFGRGK